MENNNDNSTPVLENKKRSTKERIFSFIKWFFIILFLLYIGILVARGIWLEKQEVTEEKIQEIHAKKINIDDALGKNLPSDPGEFGNKTLKGVDVNENGIRDDVEIAIFKKYPESAKMRAALLQYAFAFERVILEKKLNTKLSTELAREVSRGAFCIGEALMPRSESFFEKYMERSEWLRSVVFNTEERKEVEKDFLDKVRSYSDLENYCDVDYSQLPN